MAGASDQISSSLAEMAQVLSTLQSEMHSLREENKTLRLEMSKLSKRGEDSFSKTYLRTPKFQFPDPLDPQEGLNNPPTSAPVSQSAQPVQISVAAPVPVPLAPPERFNGDSSKYSIFMNQCQLHFICRPAAFPDDSAKVAFILSYLVGNVALWSIPLVEADNAILYSLPAFKGAMRKLFARHTYMQAVDNELLEIGRGVV